MVEGKSKFVPLLSAFVDLLLMILSFIVARYYAFEGIAPEGDFYIIAGAGCLILWIIIAVRLELYELPRILFIDKVLSKNVFAIVAYTFLSGGLIFFITDYKFSRFFFGITIVIFMTFILCWRIVSIFLLKRYRRSGFNYRKIVLIGYNENLENLIEKVYLNPNYGFKIEGLFADEVGHKKINKYYKGNLSQVFEFLEANTLDEIVVSLDYKDRKLINKLLKYADNNMLRARVIPEFSEYLYRSFTIDYTENIPILQMRREPLQSLTNRIFKRAFDFVASLFSIVFIFSWLFPIIALIIKFTSKGPVFFVQERTGKDGASFKCFKFRSMVVNEKSDELQATKNDARVTPFGTFIRRTSIDELPQIVNVLFNQMSLVGPRPHMLKHTDEYRLLVDKFMVRHFAKPGVTGWAQTNGFRGETKTVKDMENRAEADIWYIENWSFLLDLKIVFNTMIDMFHNKDKNAF
tara:strand:- start:2971 stop:4362 length:1392 start_codon:yes stop_codon:yes gene_type:complete